MSHFPKSKLQISEIWSLQIRNEAHLCQAFFFLPRIRFPSHIFLIVPTHSHSSPPHFLLVLASIVKFRAHPDNLMGLKSKQGLAAFPNIPLQRDGRLPFHPIADSSARRRMAR